MQRLLTIAVFALAGCPPPPRYIVTDVTAERAPLPNALVAASCGPRPEPQHRNPAGRTDEEGRARLHVSHGSGECSLLVAKPGYPTVETGPVNVCPTPGACSPTRVDLTPPAALAPAPRAPRTYAEPTSGRRPLEVAQ